VARALLISKGSKMPELKRLCRYLRLKRLLFRFRKEPVDSNFRGAINSILEEGKRAGHEARYMVLAAED